MVVLRIVPNIAADDIVATQRFYRDLLGMETIMDLGWIATLGGTGSPLAQISIATEGGSGTPVPDMSIEVDDVDETLASAKRLGIAIEYGPSDEPWGVRRFYVRDPAGKLINILSHR